MIKQYRHPLSTYYWIYPFEKNIIYQFKSPLRDYVPENNIIYIVLISSTLSGWLTMHLSDTTSIKQHLKNITAQKLIFAKFLIKTQQYKNNKITSNITDFRSALYWKETI